MKNKKGFTLIELLAVIVILAIILVIPVPRVIDVLTPSRAGGWDNIVKSVKQSIELGVNTKDANTGRYKYTISSICNNETNIDVPVTQTIRTISDSEYVNAFCKKNLYYIFTLSGTGDYEGKSATIKCTSKGVCSLNPTEEALVSYDISYSETVTLQKGKYKLEVWGAQGGSTKSSDSITSQGGYGGYSVGYINLTSNTTLYVVIGGAGQSSEAGTAKTLTGGYNGGGDATHIALLPGLLSKLSGNTDKILIVAGGGGGGHTDTDGNSYNTIGGNAGGYIGNSITQISNSCSNTCITHNYPSGGTQTTGGVGVTSWMDGTTSTTSYVGTFGKGATGKSSYGGGGGGYYGGASGDFTGGGGGSSYISPSLTDAAMYCYNCAQSSAPATKTISNNLVNNNPEPMNSKIGAGYARITYISQ